MRLTTITQAAFGLLLLISVGFAGKYALDRQAQLHGVERAEQGLSATSSLATIAEVLAAERGLTNGYLNSGAEWDAEVKARVGVLRATASEHFAKLARSANPTLVEEAAAIDRAVQAARAPILGLDRGASALSGAWFQGMTQAITAVTGVMRRDIDQLPISTPEMIRSTLIVQLALVELAEAKGQERGFLNGVIAGRKPMTQGQARTMGMIVGASQAPRTRVSEWVAQATDLPADLRTGFLATLAAGEAARDEQTALSASNEPYSVTPKQWFEAATKVIDALNRIRLHNATQIDAAIQQVIGQISVEFYAAVGVFAAILLIYLAVMRMIHVNLLAPIVNITRYMGQMANRDYSVSWGEGRRKNEITQMLGALATLRDNLIAGQKAELAEAELADARRRQVDLQRLEARDSALLQFHDTAVAAFDGLLASVTSLTQTAERLKAEAGVSAVQSASVASASDQATQSVAEIAGVTEQLSGSIFEISRQVIESTATVAKAADRTAATAERMHHLKGATAQISTVSSLIRQIAEQTNLLALNATIEAARAGAAGRGFAVVATEVKGLANQTAEATEQITAQLETVITAIGAASDALTDIRTTVDEVSDRSQAVAAAVEEQTAATQSIAANAEQAARGVENVGQSISEMKQSVDSTDTMARTVASAADAVTARIADLQAAFRQLRADLEAA